ncbi:MAG: ferrichrome-iron receptor, partial [Verrucomicrobia bacterium]|nr:ferrichrome-iron receptor [Verrucomicrobiota bacterium]
DYYYEHSTYLYPSLTYKWSSDTWLSLKMDYVREDRQANDGLVVPFLNIGLLPPINVTYTAPDAKDTDYGESLTALFQTRLLDVWTARVAYRATWHTDSRRAIEVIQGAIVSDPVDYRNSSITGRFKLQDNSRRYNFIDANVSGELGPKAFRHTLIAGVSGGKEWSDFYRVAQKPNYPGINLYRSAPDAPGNYPAIPPILPSYQPQDRKTTLWNYGAYASDKLTLGERWDATAGVRWDKQDAYQYEVITNRGIKSTTTCVLPSIGLLYHAARQVSVYANYCEGFKPQTSGNVDASDNPNFPSESSTQVELGVKVQALDERLTLALGAYDIRKRNVLSATGQTAPSGNPIANLSGLQESTGVEFDTTYQPWPNWEIRVGATYIDARVKKSTTASIVGAQLDNSPHASGNFWTRYNFSRGALRGLGFGIGAIYVGQRQGIITNVPAARLEAPSYARLDVGVYYGKGRYNYALNVGNITDRLYVAAIQQGDATRINPGDPRKITFSVKTQF